jgi:hypothetical protein
MQESITGRGATLEGALLFPLLPNLYRHPLDPLMQQSGYWILRYADDFVIPCASKAEADAAWLRAILRKQESRPSVAGARLIVDDGPMGSPRARGCSPYR